MSDPSKEQLETMMRGRLREELRAAESFGWPAGRVAELALEAGILPTTPPPPPPPDLHAALDKIDVRRTASLLPNWINDTVNGMNKADVVSAVIDAIREQLPPPVTR